MSTEAMKQALNDICGAKLCEINSMSSRHEMIRLQDNAIAALRQAIEQAEKQEPVALKVLNGEICYLSKADDQSYGMWCPVVPDKDCEHGFKNGTVFYTAPPKREWVDLTFEGAMAIAADFGEMDSHKEQYLFVQAINAKLKQMNT